MSYSAETPVLAEEHGAVLLIRLNRPQAANALNPAMLQSLRDILDRAADDRHRVLVIAANGRNFCAGSDLKAAIADPAAMDLRNCFNPILLALMNLGKPVVVAVNGAAAGGGMGLALTADVRIMGAAARYVPSWLALGLVPDLGVTWQLARQMGPAQAFGWLAAGAPMTSLRALELGLASQIVADGDELAAALEIAARLSSIPGPAAALTRQLLAQAGSSSFAVQLEAEAVAQAQAMRHPDQIAALKSGIASLGRVKPST